MGSKPKPSDLAPVPWADIKPHYEANVRSMSAIAAEFGVSRAAIIKHAGKHGWVRARLEPAIRAESDRILAQASVTADATDSVTAEVTGDTLQPPPKWEDGQIVEAGGQQLAMVRLNHRKDIAGLRAIIASLMRELAGSIDAPEQMALAYDALANFDESAVPMLRDLVGFVTSLPARTKVAKDLADALHKCIGMEREAFGLDTAGGTDGIPMVLVRDFTGRGDSDSPHFNRPAG